MKNLVNFFFSFDKLFKEKLVVPTFWVALIYFALEAIIQIFDWLRLDPLNYLFATIKFFTGLLLMLLIIRIVAELAVALFRINDNLSPDKGRSELVDIDPVAETRRAAELAAARTREMTKTATDRTKLAVDNVRDQVEDTTGTLTAKARAAVPGAAAATTAATKTDLEATEAVMGKGSVPEPGDAPTPVKALEPSAVDAAAVKKRGPGRPKGSTNKATSASKAKTATAASATKSAPVLDADGNPVKRGRGRPKGSKNKPKTSAAAKPPVLDADGNPVKRGRGRPKGSKNKPKVLGPDGKPVRAKPGPKPGTKVLRDADGNALKKDGTPRKKPGPKPKPKSDATKTDGAS